MEAIRILIADDQSITRTGLRNLLQEVPGFEMVGEATNGQDAIDLAASLQPDVILMDLRMPGVNGIDATRQIHRASPHIAIMVVTIFDDDTSVFPAIRAGASGYLLKDADRDELTRSIRTVAAGGVIFSSGIAQRVLKYLSAPYPGIPTKAQAFDELTNRERQILDLLARGYSNAQIAEHLALSPKTVANNISNVLTKLQAADRAKLMLMALQVGLGKTEDKWGRDE